MLFKTECVVIYFVANTNAKFLYSACMSWSCHVCQWFGTQGLCDDLVRGSISDTV